MCLTHRSHKIKQIHRMLMNIQSSDDDTDRRFFSLSLHALCFFCCCFSLISVVLLLLFRCWCWYYCLVLQPLLHSFNTLFIFIVWPKNTMPMASHGTHGRNKSQTRKLFKKLTNKYQNAHSINERIFRFCSKWEKRGFIRRS